MVTRPRISLVAPGTVSPARLKCDWTPGLPDKKSATSDGAGRPVAKAADWMPRASAASRAEFVTPARLSALLMLPTGAVAWDSTLMIRPPALSALAVAVPLAPLALA